MLAVAAMRIAVLCCLLALIATPAFAADDHVRGGFEINGFINLVAGWQKFSNDAVTDVAQDGSYAGPLGEFIPNVQTGTTPNPGQDNLLFAVQHLARREN